MTRSVYDFLNDSPLLDDRAMDDVYRDVPSAQLESELAAYRAHVGAEIQGIPSSASADSTATKVYLGPLRGDAAERVMLKRMSLYFDRVIADDPLLPLTRPRAAGEHDFPAFFGYEPPQGIDRNAVARAASFMRAVRPLVAHGFLEFIPASFKEPPAQIPITFSRALFAERVPQNLRDWFAARARVYQMKRMSRGWGIVDGQLTPCRAIAVGFEGLDRMMVFHLTETQANLRPDDPKILQMVHTLSDEPPDEEVFEAWIQQSTNQCAGQVYSSVATDVATATRSGAMILTSSELVAEMLTLRAAADGTVEEDIAALSLQLELPSVDEVSEQALMQIRTDHGASFEAFRIDLDRALSDLSTIRDERERKQQLEVLQHELEKRRVREVRLAIGQLRSGLLRDAAVGAISLAASGFSNGVSLLGILAAGTIGAKRLNEYLDSVRTHPGHFVLKLQQSLDKS